MLSRTIIFLLILSMGRALFAQEKHTLSGTVKSEENALVASGDVLLISSNQDSMVLKTPVLNGSFVFRDVSAGKYRLKVISLEALDYSRELEVTGNTNITVTLRNRVAQLNEVTVTGQKTAFITKNGNIIANIGSPMFSTVADPITLLSKIPGVQVSGDGNMITVIGRGQPVIYLNDQLSTIEDVRTLAVSDISSVELINNPSSKFEASGRTVLLIKTKRNDKEGWKTELAQTAAVRKYYINRASANANFRKKKLELKSSLQYNHLKTWEGNAFDFTIPSRDIISGYSVTAVTSRRPQFIGSAGIFYQFNELDYISVNASGRTAIEKFPIYTDSYLNTPSRREVVKTSNFSRQPQTYLSSNLNLNKGFQRAGINIFSGLQLTKLEKDLNAGIYNRLDGEENKLAQNRLLNSGIRAAGARLDIEKNWKNEWKSEIGASYSTAGSSGMSLIRTMEPNRTSTLAYDYREYNGAVYAQLSGNLPKISFSGGLRVEATDVDGNFTEDGTSREVARNNLNFFPKASVSYTPDSAQSYSLRYNKNINRPSFSNANQTVVYINPYFEWANNIDLYPSLYQEIAATFQYRKFNLNTGYYVHKGAVNSNFIYDSSRGVLRRTEFNFEKESGIFFNTTLSFKYKAWSSTNTVNIIYNVIEDPVATVGKARPFLYVNSSNEVMLPGNFILTATGWAVGKSHQGVFERNALFAVDTSLTKKMGKLTCSFRIDDVFASMNATEKFAINGVAADGMFYDNAREFSFSIRYAFGRLKQSGYRNRDVDDNSRRVR